ncbi:MAG: hypothetical protein KGL53_04830, partial [Elusimicrobia bacterium]|nr:hypothetical protein [Elusimicrobiota bacterium]
AAALALLWPLTRAAPARAMLYSASLGARTTAGSAGYGGREAWAAGTLRLPGGWYPSAQAGWSGDSLYSRVTSAGAGLAKGFTGVGKLRLGFTYYGGALKDGPGGSARSAELGASRAFAPRLSADLAYRVTEGDLFSGAQSGVGAVPAPAGLPRDVIHQAVLGVGTSLFSLARPLSLGVELSAGGRGRAPPFYLEGLTAGFPLLGTLRGELSALVAQSPGVPARRYFGAGLGLSFAGWWEPGVGR